MDIKAELKQLSDEDYKKFALKLLPKDTVMYGVRIPELKKIARQEAKEHKTAFLEQADYNIFEEVLLCGLIIAFLKVDIEEKLRLVKGFVPKINNWSVCDSFCAALKIKDKDKQTVFAFLQPYIGSVDEFEARFGIVMLLDFYTDDLYIDRVLTAIKEQKSEGFYAKMACAWALSVCMVRFPDKTVNLLREKTLDRFVQNKAIQKSIESYRVDQKIKNNIKKLKIGG